MKFYKRNLKASKIIGLLFVIFSMTILLPHTTMSKVSEEPMESFSWLVGSKWEGDEKNYHEFEMGARKKICKGENLFQDQRGIPLGFGRSLVLASGREHDKGILYGAEHAVRVYGVHDPI